MHSTEDIQRRLHALNLNPGTVDGVMGTRTEAAIRKFQREHFLPQTGIVDVLTEVALFPPPVERPSFIGALVAGYLRKEIKMKGWKTVIFGGLVTILGGLQATDIATIIPPQYTGLAMSVIGLIVMGLRALTTTPVGVAKP